MKVIKDFIFKDTCKSYGPKMRKGCLMTVVVTKRMTLNV